MEIQSLEEENLLKSAGNLYRLKKKVDDTAVKDIRNLFRLEKKKQLKTEKLEILRIFSSMKKQIIINQ